MGSNALERCEKHGLSYDARLTRGCVLCRREADGGAGGATRLHTLRSDLPGFVTEYAQSDPTEDMAERFAQLILHRTELAQLTSADPVIAAKVKYVLEALDRLAPGTRAALGF